MKCGEREELFTPNFVEFTNRVVFKHLSVSLLNELEVQVVARKDLVVLKVNFKVFESWRLLFKIGAWIEAAVYLYVLRDHTLLLKDLESL